MHICLIGKEYPKETGFGGIGTYQKRIADALVKKGCKVTVIAGAIEKDQEYYEDGIHVFRVFSALEHENVANWEKYRDQICNKIIEINLNDPIDIIESPEFTAEIYKFLKQHNIPTIIKLHTSYKIWSEFNKIRLNDKFHSKVIKSENICINNSDKVISCSNLLKELMKVYHPSVDVSKIEVVPNPADIENFYPIPNNHNSKIILYCGSIERRKGVFQLAKAIPIVLDELNDEEIIFRFIGNYSNIEENGKTVKENLLESIDMKYHKNIELLGKIENLELNKYYNEARIGIIPSLFDNLPYVAMEELLTELPIIASNNTGIIEMIEHEKSGLLYNPEDYKTLAKYIIELYNNPKVAKCYGEKGREAILTKYSPDKIADKMIGIYKETIDEFRKQNK